MGTKFQTVVQVPEFVWKAGYRTSALFMGSCFTENVGNKMAALKYPVDINPFGILYNPVSVAHGLRFLLQKKRFTEKDLIEHDGLWHSFFHHSRFSSSNMGEALDAVKSRMESSSAFLKNAKFLFLTFGTAWVYQHKPTGQTVSNCHKIPEKEFSRFRLASGEIAEDYRQLLADLWKFNPEIKVVFTVSPIRHWKDGAIENQRSKATLLLAVDQLVRGFGEERCNYFPAYEIVMDELRDYRFYDEDMIHLSTSAVNHIWEKFQEALIEDESRKMAEKVKRIVSAVNHKPLNQFTKEHLYFLKQSLQKVYSLEKKNPYLNFSSEKKYILQQISEIEKAQIPEN